MHDIVSMDVVECSQELIGVQLDQEWVHLLMQFLEMLLNAEDVRWNVVHHQVEVSFIALVTRSQLAETSLFLGRCINKVGMSQSYDVLMMHVTVDLQFTTLVFLVLLDFLHGDVLTRALQSAHPHGGESAYTALDLFRELISFL